MEKIPVLSPHTAGDGVDAHDPHERQKRIPHLDGLRAVAVIGVVFFHFNVPFFWGGFIGVDMFFTISGYLITRNIIIALVAGKFSLVDFYLRRFFRLYPASAFTVLVSLFTIYVTVRPETAHDVFSSALSALTFWSNVWFHRQGGYFNRSLEMRPLLHFWSLSVEEQFYFIWPALIILIYAFKGRFSVALRVVLTFLAVLSFIFATWSHYKRPDWSFYELPSRIFQFAAGALLAVRQLFRFEDARIDIESTSKASPARQPMYSSTGAAAGHYPSLPPLPPPTDINDIHDIMSLAALLVIGIAFLFLPPNPSPLITLPVTLATCVLIALPDALMCQIALQPKAPTRLGRLSYSLYLVHWPIAILGNFICLGLGIPWPVLFLLPLSYYSAVKLYECIEEPLRRPRGRVSRYVAVATIVILAFVFTIAGMRTDGFKNRFPDVNDTGWRPGATKFQFWEMCNDVSDTYAARDTNVKVCNVGDIKGQRAPLFFFGDSFTEHLSSALYNIGMSRGIYFELHFSYFCGFRPSSELPLWTGASEGYVCSSSHRVLWEHVNTVPNGSFVIVANSWNIPSRVVTTLRNLNFEVQATGKKLGLVPEPPGLNERYLGYYPCADLSVLPLGRAIAKLTGKTFRGASHCLDFEHGIEPSYNVEMERDGFWEALQTDLRGIPFFDHFAYLCDATVTPENTIKYRCRLPANLKGIIYDIGYKFDLIHYDSVGSDYITDFLHGQMARYLPTMI